MADVRVTFIQGSLPDVDKYLPKDSSGNRLAPAQMVKDAFKRARQMSARAVNQIDAIYRINKKAKQRDAWLANTPFCVYFGIDNITKRQVRVVRRRLIKVNKWIGRGPKIKIRPEDGARSLNCKRGVAGFNRRGKTGVRTINLCPIWFEERGDEPWDIPFADIRASTVAHEVAHVLADTTGLGLWTADLPKGNPARGPKQARRFAREHAKRARHNPENFEHLLLALMHPGHVNAER